jgi:hypothetical protein
MPSPEPSVVGTPDESLHLEEEPKEEATDTEDIRMLGDKLANTTLRMGEEEKQERLLAASAALENIERRERRQDQDAASASEGAYIPDYRSGERASWRTWRRYFELQAALWGWSEEEQKTRIAAALKGSAKEKVGGLDLHWKDHPERKVEEMMDVYEIIFSYERGPGESLSLKAIERILAVVDYYNKESMEKARKDQKEARKKKDSAKE